jgi:UDP-galactopyranose mutase
MGLWAYVEQSFGLWTVPGGMGVLADAMTKRLSERRVDVRLGTSALDVRLEGGRAVAVETEHGSIEADVVVCATDPRSLPALGAKAPRTRSTMPPVVCHLGISGSADLPHEVVLHGDPTLVVRTNGRAPDGCSAWTVLCTGPLSEDLVATLARRGFDVRDRVAVRVDRSPRQQVEELAGSAYGVRWQGRRTVDRKLAGVGVDGVHSVGAYSAADGTLPFVGLSAAVVAEEIGSVRRG